MIGQSPSDILACPVCHSSLANSGDSRNELQCVGTAFHTFKMKSGIWDFVIDVGDLEGKSRWLKGISNIEKMRNQLHGINSEDEKKLKILT